MPSLRRQHASSKYYKSLHHLVPMHTPMHATPEHSASWDFAEKLRKKWTRPGLFKRSGSSKRVFATKGSSSLSHAKTGYGDMESKPREIMLKSPCLYLFDGQWQELANTGSRWWRLAAGTFLDWCWHVLVHDDMFQVALKKARHDQTRLFRCPKMILWQATHDCIRPMIAYPWLECHVSHFVVLLQPSNKWNDCSYRLAPWSVKYECDKQLCFNSQLLCEGVPHPSSMCRNGVIDDIERNR